jgi:hypothetical protein
VATGQHAVGHAAAWRQTPFPSDARDVSPAAYGREQGWRHIPWHLFPQAAGYNEGPSGCCQPRHRRFASTRSCLTTGTGDSTAASQAPPPRHLQMPSRHPTAIADTAAPPFRTTGPLRRAAAAIFGQPRLSPRSATWGGAVARRPLLTALSSADPYIFYSYLVTQPVGSCLHKKFINKVLSLVMATRIIYQAAR